MLQVIFEMEQVRIWKGKSLHITLQSCMVYLLIMTLLSPGTALSAEGPPPPPPPKMTLNECVVLALVNNLDVRGAYLDRIVQRFTLQQAEQRFWLPSDPELTLSAATNSTYNATGDRTQDFKPGGTFVSKLGLPTGATIDVTWENSAYRQDIGVAYAYTSGWKATLLQPLLKGGGVDNATFAVKSARIAEEQNILGLRQTISERIGTAIANFRAYASFIRTLENRKKSLENARQTYEINKALIAAGRMARTELIQSEADIANQEFEVVSARNDLDAARLTLLSFLNIDKNFIFEPAEESSLRVTPPPLQEALETALRNRPDFIGAVYNQEVRKWALKNATRNKMWALNLRADTFEGETGDGRSYEEAFKNQSIAKRNWSIGLDLVIPITALTDDKKAYLQARNDFEKGEWALKKMRTDIEIAVQNAIRNVEMQQTRLALARQAVLLSQQKLDIENEKLKAGRTTNFQLVSFQNDLKNQQDAETLALRNYLDSLSQLDAQLGITLDRWGISIKKEDDAIRIPESEKSGAERKLLELNRTSASPERKGP